MAVELGFEKLIFRNGQVKFYFVNRPDSKYFESDTFKNILDYIQKQTRQARLRQNGKLFMLVLSEMDSMKKLLEFMQRMYGAVMGEAEAEWESMSYEVMEVMK